MGGFANPFATGGGHDHAAPSQHGDSTSTMAQLGHEDFEDAEGTSPSLAEADIVDSETIAVAALFDGFYLVDVSDPSQPQALSHTPVPGFNADVKAGPEGEFVFLAGQTSGSQGILAFNVQIPERPVLAGAWPLGIGCHMLNVHGSYLYCAPNDATVRIFEITRTPAGVGLTPAGVYAPFQDTTVPVTADPQSYSGENLTHDMTVQSDPVTGEPVMFVSFWDRGVHAVDVSNPASPTQLGVWRGEGLEEAYHGNLHTSMASTVDGQRIVATVSEYAPNPSVMFVNATDYSNMTGIGAWEPFQGTLDGGDVQRFSTHNFQFLNGRVYLAMYHGGVWVIDASSNRALERPSALGYHRPADARQLAGGLSTAPPDTWDVVVQRGVIYASDVAGGLFALHYENDTLADQGPTSFA